tara:strand:+ start:98349 stop:98963 length:615 start_codon:yes stop_codon:yes gene_type:complete
MIKNIVFDFGDVFINLDKQATLSELYKLGVREVSEEMFEVSKLYEVGNSSTREFIDKFIEMFPQITEANFKNAWNAILKDFPDHRFDFLKSLVTSKKYRLFLLSNTNDLHISWVQENWGQELFAEFKNCFEQFYLSHELHLRKPNADIYEFVLNENNLKPEETFFIDDTQENTRTAEKLGIKVWNINPSTEDVIDLLSRKEFNS